MSFFKKIVDGINSAAQKEQNRLEGKVSRIEDMADSYSNYSVAELREMGRNADGDRKYAIALALKRKTE